MAHLNKQTLAEQSRVQETAPVSLVAVEPSEDLSSNVGKETVMYWRQRLRDCPLHRALTKEELYAPEGWFDTVHDWDVKFDWERYVLLLEAVWKYSQKGKMVSKERPKKLRTYMVGRNKDIEVPTPYQSYYTGLLETAQPNDLYTECYSLTHYDIRTHYKFTIGNYEAALNITKHIWKDRLKYKGKNNWKYIITPICFEFLSRLQTELNGYQEEFMTKIRSSLHSLDKQKEIYEAPWVEEILSEVPQDQIEIEILEDTNEMEPIIEEPEEDQEVPANVDVTSESEEEQEVKSEPQKKKKVKYSPFRWYPRIKPFGIRRKNPAKTFTLSYFDNLVDVYYRIGRPDLAKRIQTPIRIDWLRKKINATPEIRNWEPQGKDDCEKGNKFRSKALRMLSQYRALMARHLDKMEVLSHRGRFAYLTSWDLSLFVRQKRIILSIDKHSLMNLELIYAFAKQECKIPETYVEEALYALKAIDAAAITQSNEKIWVAIHVLLVMIARWVDSEFDKNKTICEEWQAQSDEKPVLGAAAPQVGNVNPTGSKVEETKATSGEKKVTMTMVDDRKIQKASPSQEKPVKTAESTSSEFYSMLKIVNRPMFIDRTEWAITDTATQELKQWIVPNVYFDSSTKTHSVCQNLTASYITAMFGSVKFSMKIRCVCNSVKFQQGRLILYFKPFYDQNRSLDIIHNCTQYPHAFIDASKSNPVELEIPWTNFRDAFPIYNDPHSEYNYFGTVHLAVWNELATGTTGSTDATISTWMWLENFEPYQLCNPKDPGSVTFASRVMGTKGEVGSGAEEIVLTPLNRKILTIDHWEPQMMEQVVNTGVGLVTELGTGLVEGLYNKLLHGGNDKPIAVLPPRPVIPRVMTNTAWAEGPDICNRLSLEPLSVSTPPKGEKPPCNMRDRMKEWSRFAVAEWRTTDNENSRIIDFPIMPMVKAVMNTRSDTTTMFYKCLQSTGDTCKVQYKSLKFDSIRRHGTMLDYLSRAFLYWRGGLRFKFEVVKTDMHSGRVLIRYEPYGNRNSAIAECQKFATPGVTWDVQEKSELELVAPYMSVQPWLSTQYVSAGAIQGATVTQSSNGLIEMTVMNKLKVTTGIASYVKINIYIAAADDFEFAVPSPLDSLITVRDCYLLSGPSTPGSSTGYQKIFDMLYEYVSAPCTLRWLGTEEKDGWIVIKNDERNRGLSGPLVERVGIGKLTYAQFVLNANECRKQVLAANREANLDDSALPRVNNIIEAYNVLRELGKYVPVQANPAWYETSVAYSKLVYHLAAGYLLLGQYSVRDYPHLRLDQHIIGVKAPESGKVKKWQPQSNDKAQITAIDPFSQFIPPKKTCKQLFGEDFSDMYKVMKRSNMWLSIDMPPRFDTTQFSDEEKQGWPDYITDVDSMSPFELDNYFVEWKIPVTPFLPPHIIGDRFNMFVDGPNQDFRQLFSSLRLPFRTTQGADAGSFANLITPRFFGELFTFWRGSMRFKFVMPTNTDSRGRPWWMMIAFQPRCFTTKPQILNDLTIVHAKRLRDMSKMGMELFCGNVMNTIDVEVPYYSKYSKLYLSDAKYDDTTTNGSLSIFVPIRRLSTANCKFDFEKFAADSLRLNIMTSIGDDMEFITPRSAPIQVMWPKFYNRLDSSTENFTGYDTLNAQFVSGGAHDVMGSLHKDIVDHGVISLPYQSHPFKAITAIRNVNHVFDDVNAGGILDQTAEKSLKEFKWNTVNWAAQGNEERNPFKTPRPEVQFTSTDNAITRRIRGEIPNTVIAKTAEKFPNGLNKYGKFTDDRRVLDCPQNQPEAQDVILNFTNTFVEEGHDAHVKHWSQQSDESPTLPPPSRSRLIDDAIGPISEEEDYGEDDSIDGALASAITTIKGLPSVMQDFKLAATSATEAVTSVKDTLTIMGEAVIAMKDTTTKATESVSVTSNTIGNIASYTFNATRVALFFKGLVDAMSAEEWSDRWMPIASCAMALGLSPDIVMKAGEWLMSGLTSILGSTKVHENRTPQSYEEAWDMSWTSLIEEHASTFRLIAAAVVTIATFYLTSEAPIHSKVASFSTSMLNKLRNFAIVGTAIKTLDWLFKWIAEVIKVAFVSVADWMSGGMITAHQMSNHYPEVISWLKSIEMYKVEINKSNLAWDANARLDLWKKMDEGELLLKKITSKTGSLFNTIMRGMTSLQKAHDEMMTAKHAPPFRKDPFHLCLTGEPGVGKSSILTFIIDFIFDAMGYPKTNRYYNRNEDEKHWSGYKKQLAVIIDDIFSNRKGEALLELVKMKSNIAWVLVMAQLEEKGMHFQSELVGSTTNTPFPQPPDATCPQAIWRRREILADVKRTRMLAPGEKMKWSDLRFDLIDPNPQDGAKHVITADLTLEQLMVLCLEMYRKWNKDQTSLVFSALHGKKVTLMDYGDDTSAPRAPIANNLECMLEALRRGVTLSDEYLIQVLNGLSYAEYCHTIKIQANWDALQKYEVFQTFIKDNDHRFRINEIFKHAESGIARNVLASRIQTAVRENLFHCVSDDDKEILTPIVNGKIMMDMGHLEVEKPDDGPVVITYVPQAGMEDFLDVIEDRESVEQMRTSRLADAHEAARRTILEREQGMVGFEAVSKSMERTHRVGKDITIADVSEIKSFVETNYLNLTPRAKETLVSQFTTVFNLARKTDSSTVDHNELSKQFAKLFDVEYNEYWKKNESKEWIMEFPDSFMDNADNLEIYSLYYWMVEAWTQKEIDNFKELCPPKTTLGDSKIIQALEKFYSTQKAKVTGFFEKHPWITTMLKVSGAMAALFASYKLIQWVCPKIIEKLKYAWYGIFGWTVAKIGEERIDYVRQKGKQVATTTKGYLTYIKQLMIHSKDPDLIEATTDDEKVERFAEMLERQVKSVKNTLLMQDRSPEGKKKVVNPYMVGVQDRVAVEGATRTPAETTAMTPFLIKPQGSADPNATTFRNNVLSKNVCRVAWANMEKSVSMAGVFVEGRVLLVPYHFFAYCTAGQHFVITLMNGVEYWDVYQPERCVKIRDQDACVYTCGLRIGQFQKISKHFMQKSELVFRNIPATLNICSETLYMVVHPTSAALIDEVKYSMHGEEIRNALAWEYEVPTLSGDCGSVLLADSTGVRSKLLGIHVCGVVSQNLGASALIFREDLEEAISMLPVLSNVKPTEIVPYTIITKPVEAMKVQPQGNFTLLGAVAPSKAVRLPHKTEIEKSMIYEMIRDHVTEPAILDANDERNVTGESPLLRAISKYGKPTIPFNPVDLSYVTMEIKTEALTWTSPMGKRKLTDHEGVFGNELIEFCDRMNLSAAPGYPWINDRPSGEKGKAYLYDINAEDGIRDENYRYHYKAREDLAKEGIRKLSIWTDCLKDERRPMHKIEKASTRAFVIGPADFTHLCRKYLMAFCVAFYTNNITSFSAVGMDPYSYDWTRLVRKLRKKSNLGFGGDFHSFDGILDPDIIWSICNIINDWYEDNPAEDYDPRDRLVREVLFEEIIHTVQICLNSVYISHQGNPSGCPLTVIINTIAHKILMMLVWIEIMKEEEPGLVSLYHFRKNIADIYYGDDGLLAVKFDVIHLYNQSSVSKCLAKHKIEYTSEAKDEELYGVRRVKDCTFLKNGFTRLDGTQFWLAPISQDTIYELTNWIRKSDNPVAQLRENLENAINFAFHHGRNFFDRFCMLVNSALSSKGLREIAFSYEIMRDIFLAKCR